MLPLNRDVRNAGSSNHVVEPAVAIVSLNLEQFNLTAPICPCTATDPVDSNKFSLLN